MMTITGRGYGWAATALSDHIHTTKDIFASQRSVGLQSNLYTLEKIVEPLPTYDECIKF